jgi:hypothetical protein
MGRISRKFRIDSKSGRIVEFTEREVRAACEEIAAGTNVFKRALFSQDDSLPRTQTRRVAQWPIKSLSAAINPEDVDRQQDVLRQQGVSTEYEVTREGDTAMPIFRDRKHRADHCRVLGLVDMDGGYGDYCG